MHYSRSLPTDLFTILRHHSCHPSVRHSLQRTISFGPCLTHSGIVIPHALPCTCGGVRPLAMSASTLTVLSWAECAPPNERARCLSIRGRTMCFVLFFAHQLPVLSCLFSVVYPMPPSSPASSSSTQLAWHKYVNSIYSSTCLAFLTPPSDPFETITSPSLSFNSTLSNQQYINMTVLTVTEKIISNSNYCPVCVESGAGKPTIWMRGDI